MGRSITIKISSILAIIILICYVLNSGYLYVLVNDTYTLVSLFIVGFFVIWRYGFRKKKLGDYRVLTQPFIVLCIWILLCMIIHFEVNIWGSYFRQILVLVVATLVACSIDFKTFKRLFLNFMLFATVVSIIAWILVNILHIDLPLPIINSTWEKAYYTEYKNGILFFIYLHQPERLMGPFWEPGLYASMALFALLFNEKNNLLTKRERRRRFVSDIILTIGIILSMSTSGYILVLLIFVIRYFLHAEKNISFISFAVILLLIASLIIFQDNIFTYLARVLPDIFGKFVNDSMSKSTRLNGPLVDLSIFINNPLIGAGMKGYQDSWPLFADLFRVESRTSTITYFLANFGVLGVLYIYEMIYGVVKQKSVNGQAKVFIILFFIAILTKEPHYFNLFVCTTIAYFYNDNCLLTPDQK